MKKFLPILFVLTLFALCFQFIVVFFVGDHDITYSLKTDNNKYLIREKYIKRSDDDVYDFTVVDNNSNFYTFTFLNDYNKQDKIIKNIEYYTTKDLQCIMPVYKKKKTAGVSCIYKGEQVSYDYLKQLNNYDINTVVNSLKKKGYKFAGWDQKNNKSKSIERIKVYQKNILKNYIFTIWNYKGIYILKDKGDLIDKEFFTSDRYDNSLSALVGKYYVYFDCTGECSSASELGYYNIKDMGRGSFPIKYSISSDVYINGVYKNNMFITDSSNRKQYKFNPALESMDEVGDTKSGFSMLVDDSMMKVSKNIFLKNKIYFDSIVDVDEIYNKYGKVKIMKDGHFYYFLTKDGRFYRNNIDNKYKSELLFKFPNINEWKVKDGDIIFVNKDTVWFYNDLSGLSKIAVDPELIYNHKNIVDFYK